MQVSKADMQRTMIRLAAIALLAAAGLSLAGCEEEGPAERMGERLDDALSQAQDRLEDAREEVEEAVDEVNEALQGE